MPHGQAGGPREPQEPTNLVNLAFGALLSLAGLVCVLTYADVIPRFSKAQAEPAQITMWLGIILIAWGTLLGAPRGLFAFQQVKELLPFLHKSSEPPSKPVSPCAAVAGSADKPPGEASSGFPELPGEAKLPNKVKEQLGLKAEPPPLEQADTDLIRQTLFESNVPTYILNQDYHLLDWNPAFEVAFRSEKFKRLRHVSQLIHCLANREDVLAHGAAAFGGSQKPLVDLEIMEYVSPEYGRMEFSKITSQATHGLTGETIGWNVVLNVNSVERRAEFDKALEVELSRHVNWRIYSAAYDKVLTRFKGYRELVKRHCNAVAARNHILDLGAGTGNATLELLKAGKQVVAIEFNEAMLSRLREKCRVYSAKGTLQVVKQNLEMMHISKADRGKYDGAILLNVLYNLNDPVSCLKLVRNALAPNGILVVSGPKKDSRLDTLFTAIQRELENETDWETLSHDLDIVRARNQELEAEGVLYRFTIDDVRRMLEEAGFQVIEQDDQAYSGQAMYLVAKKL